MLTLLLIPAQPLFTCACSIISTVVFIVNMCGSTGPAGTVEVCCGVENILIAGGRDLIAEYSFIKVMGCM